MATQGGLSISTDAGTSFTNKTTSNGLGEDKKGVNYVGTDGGLSISTDSGTSFSSKTTSDGLAHNQVKNLYLY
ncbi:hypothetical protein OAK75_08450 [Bacteriovoracales bacterium]|nr:hypothetical protein [Bacteriovoracales bacterium]